MKNIIFILGLSLSLFAEAKSGIQYTSSTSGFTYFTGAIVMPACHIALDNTYQYIDLGKVSTEKISLIGETTPPTEFNFKLDSCDKYIVDELIITINDNQNRNSQLISVEKGKGYAKNVSIVLYNYKHPIVTDEKFKPAITSNDLGTFIPFSSKYKVIESRFVNGKIDAALDLSVYYQ
ncbi:hypothetical protein EX217_03625 [Providencia rettgeri]|uniref:fimbrial protein n=1 Tax=Providencia TaxID=586 RepID=UPI001C839C41|nr:fimbrial protein [Providencia rettgeri]ELT5687786.1 hypothetical protein [Providencia rettgeri]MBX6966787.1 hypothetical protein [Providencia rettgeri]MBX6975061.1 hypothetical protein [Providencia rettgeri]MBX6994071.1 hypothetical protein [Providencia rettgeri]MBX6999276.1 hypothetical protein [Providencia rettgeri]